MQMLYVIVIWRKIQFRNMGVISISPMQAGDTGGCKVSCEDDGRRREKVWGHKGVIEEPCCLASNYANSV